MEARYYLLNRRNEVVAEIIDKALLSTINTITMLVWNGRNYVYSYQHQNRELTFFVEVGEQAILTDDQLAIRE